MQENRSIQNPSTLLMRWAVVCGVITAVACAGAAGVAQENYQHHHQNQIYAIGVDDFASSGLLGLLSRDYSIIHWDQATTPFTLYPVVIGPAALANQDVTSYLVQAYRAGLTVAIAYATPNEADRFNELVEGEPAASCKSAPGARRIALYALQKSTRNQPDEASRYCLPRFVPPGPRTDESDDGDMEGQSRNQSGETVGQWLTAAFGPQAPPPPLPSTEIATGDSVNLDSLSQKTHCSELVYNGSGQVQDDLFVTSLRSFDSQRDYYYLQNFPQIKSYVAASYFSAVAFRPFLQSGSQHQRLIGTRLLFSQPATTTSYVSGYTNERSTTVSGSVGFSGLSLNVEASVSVTVGTSTTVSVPPVTIENLSNLASADAYWTFRPASPQPNLLYDTATSWVWYIDRDIYGPSPNDVPEVLTNFGATTANTTATGLCGFPPPFPTFHVDAPVITSVDPEAVQRGGGTFLIRGAGMYPGILRNVLLGGDALPTANFVPVNDKEIRVVVPSSQNKGPNAIQVNTLFKGSILPSNTDIKVNVK